jgi:predicted ester cyclase
VEENKVLVRRLMEAINNHDFDALKQLVAHDVVDHNAVIFMQPDGPGGVEDGVRKLLEGFPDLHIEVEELLAEAERVSLRG